MAAHRQKRWSIMLRGRELNYKDGDLKHYYKQDQQECSTKMRHL